MVIIVCSVYLVARELELPDMLYLAGIDVTCHPLTQSRNNDKAKKLLLNTVLLSRKREGAEHLQLASYNDAVIREK